ncbi:MAG: FHA domain-containing protein [Thermoanaerobaculia bacterium]
MPAKLTLYPSRGASRHWVLPPEDELRAGRDADSDVLLQDPRVSGRHALLCWDGTAWSLADAGSKNGTFVNGARADGSPLADGDWISFGGLLGRYELISEQQARALRETRAARLQTTADIQRSLTNETDPALLLRRLIASVLDVVGAERGFVLVLSPDGRLKAEVAAGFAGRDTLDGRFDGSWGAVRHVMDTRKPLVASDARADALLGHRPSVVDMGIGALACVPLVVDGRLLGLIYVDGRKSGGLFTELDLEILEALANHAGLVVAGMRIDRQIRELLSRPGHVEPAETSGFLSELTHRVEHMSRSARGPLPAARGGG